MSCCKNGKTYVDSILPVSGTTTTYVVSLTHYLCNGKRVFVNSLYPVSGTLAYQFTDIQSVGNSAYSGTLLISGTITYVPYYCNNVCCNICPIPEPILITVPGIPLTSETVPTITGGTVIVTPSINCDGVCSTNMVNIETSIALTVPTTTEAVSTEELKVKRVKNS